MKKIKILGAGLSGLSAAINLAKAGYKVDVFERNKDVGVRFNGDIQGLENWSEKKDVTEQILDSGIKINFDCDPFSHLELNNKDKLSTFSSKKPLFYLVKRGPFEGSIDYGLKKQALAEGVNIHFKETIPYETADVIATGPIFKELLGIDKGIIFDTDLKDTACTALDDNLAFSGYSYLLVTKGKGCMCTMVVKDTTHIKDYFENTKNYFLKKYKMKIKNPKPAGGVGSFSIKHCLEIRHKKHNCLYIGEAAGLQDFLWGFGMRFAIESGNLASQSIINNKDYEMLAKKAFSNKLKATMVNRFLWEKFDNNAYSFIVKHPNLVYHFIRSFHNFNIAQRALFPFAESYLKKKYPKLEL